MKTEVIIAITFIFLFFVGKVSAGLVEDVQHIMRESEQTTYEMDVHEALSYLHDNKEISRITFITLDYIIYSSGDDWREVVSIYDTYRNSGKTDEAAADSVANFYGESW